MVAEKGVSPAQVEAFAPTAIALLNLVAASFVSNSSHLGSLPGRIPLVPTVLKGRGSYWWNTDTARPIDSALHDIFDRLSPSCNLIRRQPWSLIYWL